MSGMPHYLSGFVGGFMALLVTAAFVLHLCHLCFPYLGLWMDLLGSTDSCVRKCVLGAALTDCPVIPFVTYIHTLTNGTLGL